MGILLSLVAALCWGVADFYAAFVSRRIGSVRTQIVTQGLELLVVAVFLVINGTMWPSTNGIWPLALGLGLMQCVGILFLYRAFEIGTLSIVAPIASSFVVFTAIFAWLDGERAGWLALMGALFLFIGVVLVTQSPTKDETAVASYAGVWQALLAAICIGVVFWKFQDLAVKTPTLWPILPLRCCSVVGGTLVLLVNKQPVPASPPAEERKWPLWLLIVVVTLGNVFAWTAFNAAGASAYATVVAAVSSLFSAVTVFLAWLVLKERLAPIQWGGVAVILVGVVLVSL